MLAANPQSGFTYIGLMIIVMIIGAGLAATGTFFSHQAQREKERELLFVGDQFRAAIGSYYRRSPGAASYPKKLEDLLEDKRFPMPVRHLRRLYADPMTGKPDWGLVQAPGDGGIMGIYSASAQAPIKTDNFDVANEAFKDAEHYADWKFVFKAPEPVQPPPQAPAPAPKS